MPTISVEGPPMADLNKKRELVKGMTEVATKVYGLPPEAMIVVIRENLADVRRQAFGTQAGRGPCEGCWRADNRDGAGRSSAVKGSFGKCRPAPGG